MLRTCILAVSLVAICSCEDKPLVTTPLGKIRGTLKASSNGRKYASFEGIPFAKPPIGDRRFEAPEPVEPWSGIWEANFRSECAQTSTTPGANIMPGVGEDCLHINVYVPRELPDPKEKLDVIVHIHGGAYMYGSGHGYTHPRFLMDHDVIFVTFNYRVGILGFLSTQDEVLPGNGGMKDQVLALKWVQENIASFGGNPDSVTLTGLSAGGSAVHLHYFSEMSKGLFHRGLAQSGFAFNPWSFQEEPLAKAKTLGEAVGCPTDCTKKLVQCLKQRPFKHLLSKINLFFTYKHIPYAPFAPVVERGGQNRFLGEDPYVLLKQGKVYDVPLIGSATAHEGFLTFTYFDGDVKEFNEKWERVADAVLDYTFTLPESARKSVAQKIRSYYLKDQTMTEENLPQVAQIFSDRLFLNGAEIAVREQAEIVKSPIYFYYFNYSGDGESKIVNHGADAKYYFGDAFTGKPLTANELKMKDVIVEMLVAYAKTGVPKIDGVDWKPTGSEEFTFLNVEGFEPENLKLTRVEELTPRRFWKSLGFEENGYVAHSVKGEL